MCSRIVHNGHFFLGVQTANTWVRDVAEEFATDDRRFAYRVLRAWLHTLRDRLTVEASAHFAAQQPELVRGIYYEGWNPSRVPEKYRPAHENKSSSRS